MGTLLQLPVTVQNAVKHVFGAYDLIADHCDSCAQFRYRLLISSKDRRYKEAPLFVRQRGRALHCSDSQDSASRQVAHTVQLGPCRAECPVFRKADAQLTNFRPF